MSVESDPRWKFKVGDIVTVQEAPDITPMPSIVRALLRNALSPGYRVASATGAEGFVPERLLREPTADEREWFMKKAIVSGLLE